ncbi:hypothetical protein [Terrabacter sp. C0L_2]|uniref:hypothetical protein n=1 Tax=Terrabacter sp. C0L_2 TaxID=3108389 RepID=UPI002ED1EA81|nr:hypothetical protein U5C87_07555 [Terrabacter sp. C0L_2]
MTDMPTERDLEEGARSREARLQTIINDLAREGGRSQPEVVDALARAIEAEGLGTRPEPWLDAVADEIAQGNAYVVSAHAAQVTDVPHPSTDVRGETVD